MAGETARTGARARRRDGARFTPGFAAADASPRLAEDVVAWARESRVEMLDLKFVDLLGTWQHFSMPVSQLDTSLFRDGTGFDGSSIRGWQSILDSDMLVVPDPDTAFLDPFQSARTLSFICDVVEPQKRQYYARDPRHVARQAENHLKRTGLAERACFGPELEFFILDGVRFDQNAHCGYYFLDSEEGIWNSGRAERNLGYRPRHKEGYFPASPTDALEGLRAEMVQELERAGVTVEKAHHEVATAGQAEVDMRYDTLTRMADRVMLYKYVARNVARRHGKTATFMPKPILGDNGSGMHTHQSLWRNGTPLFAGKEYAGVSRLCLQYIAGILKHAPALAAFTNPTTNSYKRLTPGFEAPVSLAYSRANRSAGVRIPMYFDEPKAKRIEVRFPDPAANPYLAFSAMLMAGLDGIESKLEPGRAVDLDLYGLEATEASRVRSMPASLEESLAALEKDHEFLTRGHVFTEDLIETWLAHKRAHDVDALRLRPHPYEFFLYYDA